MADADEDIVPPQPATDVDLSEETQDFRLLSNLNILTTTQSTIPRRGEKDFEPNPTRSQQSSLAASRQAMHDALSHPRLHHPRYHVVGEFCPDSSPRAPSDAHCVRVDRSLGKMFQVVGAADARNVMWLLPEEALQLVERGSLDVRWPVSEGERGEEDGDEGVGKEEEPGKGERQGIGAVPMSLQAAYACFIGRSGLTLEKYVVYASLRRLGYTVTRAATWNGTDAHANGRRHIRPRETRIASQEASKTVALSSSSGLSGFLRRMFSFLYAPPQPGNRTCGPLVTPGLYRNYNDVFRALALIPNHDPSQQPQIAPNPAPPFHICYDVYKPSTPYKKSAPPEPDFRLAVVDARSSSVPRMDQIGALLDSMPLTPPRDDKPIEAKLKHGHRIVVLAVVDMGVVSYLKFSDAAFGNEKLYERNMLPRGKGRRSVHGGGQGQKRNNNSKPR